MNDYNNNFKIDAFNEGKEAAKQGMSIGMCPYRGEQYLHERMEWLRGYESEDKTRLTTRGIDYD